MEKRPKYRLYIYLIILSGVVLAVTLAGTSLKIISEGRHFTENMLEEHRLLLLSTLGFGHGVMAHMGSSNYENFIALALECKSIKYVGILDKDKRIILQSDPPEGLISLKKKYFQDLKDSEVVEETKDLLLVSYKAKDTEVDEKPMRDHMMNRGNGRAEHKPKWFLVVLDISPFRKHYREMVFQTVGIGSVFLLLGIFVIVFLGIVQRYELSHVAIEKLLKIKMVMGHFVPRTAKNMIEKDPGKEGLLSRYFEDATILFLDIEGYTLLSKKYPQERINQVIESYFSIFFDLIQKSQGDINETAGDGMMVIYLDADPSQHARKAVQTAMNIREECLKTSNNRGSELFPVRVNIGINSGEVHLGTTKMTGTEGERWTYTASGAITIKAARLVQHARQGQILIGDETARRIGNFTHLQSLGKVPLKNIEDSGEVFEVSEPQPSGQPLLRDPKKDVNDGP